MKISSLSITAIMTNKIRMKSPFIYLVVILKYVENFIKAQNKGCIQYFSTTYFPLCKVPGKRKLYYYLGI